MSAFYHRQCVKFDPNIQVRTLYVWQYAYRKARIGHYHLDANRRELFYSKINEIACVLDLVLDKNHREKVYKTYFNE